MTEFILSNGLSIPLTEPAATVWLGTARGLGAQTILSPERIKEILDAGKSTVRIYVFDMKSGNAVPRVVKELR